MIKRIIFLTQSPFNLRDYNRFGIQLLEQNGFKVEVWDITELVYPQVVASYVPVDLFDYESRITFCNKQELSVKLGLLSSDDFIMNMVSYNDKSLWVFRSLSKSPAEYGVFMANTSPASLQQKKRFIYYAKKILKDPFPNWERLVKCFFPKIPFSWFNIKPARLILAGGEHCLHCRYTADSHTEIVWAHSLDYDFYLREKGLLCQERPIAVFIDEYFPFHSDFIYARISSPILADTYYPMLNRFFSLIENQLNIKVVIAAHPRSDYGKHPDYFQGRTCVRGQTAKLIKESVVVVAHHGTALNYANLFHKPVIFLTSKEFENNRQGDFVKETARWFGKIPFVADSGKPIDWNSELKVDDEFYNRYHRAYIKTENSEDLPFWQIFSNRLKKGF